MSEIAEALRRTRISVRKRRHHFLLSLLFTEVIAYNFTHSWVLLVLAGLLSQLVTLLMITARRFPHHYRRVSNRL